MLAPGATVYLTNVSSRCGCGCKFPSCHLVGGKPGSTLVGPCQLHHTGRVGLTGQTSGCGQFVMAHDSLASLTDEAKDLTVARFRSLSLAACVFEWLLVAIKCRSQSCTKLMASSAAQGPRILLCNSLTLHKHQFTIFTSPNHYHCFAPNITLQKNRECGHPALPRLPLKLRPAVPRN
jgi:hypothetical protein